MHIDRALTWGAATTLTIALGAGLAACGDDGGGPGTGSDTQTASNGDVFNDADVAFATSMIPHHAQAIQMVTLTDGRRLDPEVRRLAEDIRAAQAPEVETMVDWLTSWGQEVPETPIDHANAGHGGGGSDADVSGDMPGMMSGEEMRALDDAPDAEFQDLWLEMMQEHHEGAVEMARAEQTDGESADAVDLAESIETTQEAEIETIEALLDD